MPPNRGRLATDRYRVERRLGHGSNAAVYVALDLQTGERVALKVMHQLHARDPKACKRFRREATAAQLLSTPHAVRVFDVGELADGSPFMVMELLEGVTLGRLVQDTGPLPQEYALFLADQVAAALQDAHAVGVVHRDLKPDNVFVVGEEERAWIKVVDFGISKLIGERETSRLTGTGMLVGTPLYMAPEQIRGRRDIDHRVDIYALGVLIYEMLAGFSPFGGATDFAALLRLATQPAPPLSDHRPELPQGLVDVVARAMERAPQDRIPNVESLRVGLAPFWSGEGPVRATAATLDWSARFQVSTPEPPGLAESKHDTEPSLLEPASEHLPAVPATAAEPLAGLGPLPTRVPRPSRMPPAQPVVGIDGNDHPPVIPRANPLPRFDDVLAGDDRRGKR